MPRQRRTQRQRTIQRRIHFYRASFLTGQGDASQRFAGDPRDLFDHISRLPFQLPGGAESRYSELPDANLVAMLRAERRRVSIRGVIGIVRRTALPDVERMGRLRALTLPADAGLFEATHFILFLPAGILGLEFNLFGPRSGRLEQYLAEKCEGLVDDVQFEPILRGDVQQRLQEVGEVSLLRLAVRRDQIDIVRQLNDSLASALRAARQVAAGEDVEILEIVLRRRPYARGDGFHLPLSRQRILSYVRNRQAREATADFSVRARNTRTGAMETFDLLEDKLAVYRQVPAAGERRRSVDGEWMFRAIEEEFAAHREELGRPNRD